MQKAKAAGTLMLIALVAVLAVQNAEAVELDFLAWSFSMPRVLLLILLLAVGFLAGLVVSSWSNLKSRRS